MVSHLHSEWLLCVSSSPKRETTYASPLDLILFQFLHRGSKNFAQNSWTLTGETKRHRLAPAAQHEHAVLRIPTEVDVQLVILIPRPVVLGRELYGPPTSVNARHAGESNTVGDFLQGRASSFRGFLVEIDLVFDVSVFTR